MEIANESPKFKEQILVLRHQLNVLRRKSPKRLAFGNIDRRVFEGLYRLARQRLHS
jgi:hypothetical protein